MRRIKTFAIVALASAVVLAAVLALAVGASPLAQDPEPTPAPIPTATAIATARAVPIFSASGYSRCKFTVMGPGTLRWGFLDGSHGVVARLHQTGGETILVDVHIPALPGTANNWVYGNVPLEPGSATFEIQADGGGWMYAAPVVTSAGAGDWRQPKGDAGQYNWRIRACPG